FQDRCGDNPLTFDLPRNRPGGFPPASPPACQVLAMKDLRASFLAAVCGATLSLFLPPSPGPAAEPVLTGELRLQPATITLVHPRHPNSIRVSGTTADRLTLDLTGSATFSSGDEKIAVVDAFGWVRPVASGKTTISVRAAGKTATLPVVVNLKPGPHPT